MSAFDITPKGNTIVLSGKNAQGKSSVLDSIAMLFEGKKGPVSKATPKPIKDGETSATLMAETEEFIVKKKWTDNDHEYLEITSKDGSKTYASPQAFLDGITGDLSFDPLSFSRLKAKEQRELLISIVNIGIDLLKWDAEHSAIMELRKMVGRDIDALKGKLLTMQSYPAETPAEEVSVAKLVAEVQAAEYHNTQITNADLARSKALAQIAALKEQIVTAEKELAMAEETLKGLGEPLPVKTLQANIGTAEQTNAFVRLKKERMAAELSVRTKDEEYEAMTGKLKGLVAAKEEALSKAVFPVPGLGISEDGVTFKGIPFSQCSSAEQLKVSMAIAMAKNPELRLIRITDGSLLDGENMKVLEEMATRNDFQIWVEKVDDDAKVGIIIEDGKIVA